MAFDPTRASTLLLTSLMVIGLGFFIRASTKDRIEVMQFGSTQLAEPLQQDVMAHFRSRAYRPIQIKTEEDAATPTMQENQEVGENANSSITVIGMVSPSGFMAVFLSGLAGVGLACFALIMATLYPSWGNSLFAVVLLSPLAGLFYWRKSSRPEQVTFKVESEKANSFTTKLTVQGHRDELAELRNAFSSVLQAWE